MKELEGKLADIQRARIAVSAYEQAKSGKQPHHASGDSNQRASRRGSKRDEIIRVIRENPGLARGDILERMGLKGDKSGEMSVSNTLTARLRAVKFAARDAATKSFNRLQTAEEPIWLR